MATCDEGQSPIEARWSVYVGSGATQHDACYQLSQAIDAVVGDNTSGYIEDGVCSLWRSDGEAEYGQGEFHDVCESAAGPATGNVVQCTGTCTLILTPKAEEIDVGRVADMGALTAMFFAAGIVILCVRKLGDLFTVPHDKD